MGPKISVIMSVYNEEAYLKEALESLLRQTEQDFEVILIDDGSKDRTAEIIESFHEPRFLLQRNTVNQGLTRNLNAALPLCRGQFIARMDGDDISLPRRFEKQLQYLQAHPDRMLIGTQTRTFGAQNLIWRLGDDPQKLKIMMLLRPVLAHPTFMLRRELVTDYGYRYDESFRSAQDYDFAQRVSDHFSIGIVPEVLLQYRAHEKQVSSRLGKEQLRNADRVRERQLARLQISLDERQKEIYSAWAREKGMETAADIDAARELIALFVRHNEALQLYDSRQLGRVLLSMLDTWAFHEHRLSLRDKLSHICRSRQETSVFLTTGANIALNRLRR